MPFRAFNDATASFPVTIAAPGANLRSWIEGIVLQGAGDAVLTIKDGAGTLLAAVTTGAGGGGIAAPVMPIPKGTVAQNDTIVVAIASGNPIVVTGWLDWSVR